MNKIQREEAIYYINQYVLPRLNLNTRDMSFTHPKLGSWSSDVKNGAHANLNSLAPWFYNSPSGLHYGNDTAAPEVTYPGPVGSFADPGDRPLLADGYPDAPDGMICDMVPGSLPTYKDSPNSNSNNPANWPSWTSAGQGSPFSGVPLMSYEDAEQALSLARKETEKLEKAVNTVMRKNRRLLTLAAGGH